MKYPVTGEQCYRLSPSMVQGMAEIDMMACGSHFLETNVANALLRRGFVEIAVAGEQPGKRTLYRLTERGRVALRIARRQGAA